jgi:hypothetical protein
MHRGKSSSPPYPHTPTWYHPREGRSR